MKAVSAKPQSMGIAAFDELLAVLNQLPQRLIVKDRDSVYLACNQALADDLGLPIEDIIGKRDIDLVPPELAELYVMADRQVMESKTPITLEEPFSAGGRSAWLRTTKKPLLDPDGDVIGIIVAFEDITDQRDMTEELRRHGWVLAALHRATEALVRSGTEQELLDAVCAALTHGDEYPLCWIGWARHDPERSVAMAAAAGQAIAYTNDLDISWGDGPKSRGPTGRAVREGVVAVNNRAATDPDFAPWLERASRHGIAASISLPC